MKNFNDLDFKEKVALGEKRRKMRVLRRRLLIGGIAIGVISLGVGGFVFAQKLSTYMEEEEIVAYEQPEPTPVVEAESTPEPIDYGDVKIEVVVNEPTEEEKNQSRLRIYATRPESAKVGEDKEEPKKESAIDRLSSQGFSSGSSSSQSTSSDSISSSGTTEPVKTKSSFDEAMNDAHNWMSGQISSSDTSATNDQSPASQAVEEKKDEPYIQKPSTLYGSDANKGKDDNPSEPDPMDILTRRGGFDSANDSRYIWANQPENLWSNEKKDDSENTSKSGGRFSHVPDDFDKADKSDDAEKGSDNKN